MNYLLTLFTFTLANIGIYTYAIMSKNTALSGWKILLIPLILFPVLYFSNVFFSSAWFFSSKAQIPLAIAGVLNLSIGILVFLLGDVLYFKQALSPQIIIGALLVIAGAVLINWH